MPVIDVDALNFAAFPAVKGRMGLHAAASAWQTGNVRKIRVNASPGANQSSHRREGFRDPEGSAQKQLSHCRLSLRERTSFRGAKDDRC